MRIPIAPGIQALFCVFVLAFTNALLAGGPTDKNPEMLLSPWTDDKVDPAPVEFYTNAATIYAAALEEVAGYEEKVAKGKVKSLNLLKVGTTKAYLGELEQYALRLQDWGEPAGKDLLFRAADLNRRIDKVASAMMVPFDAAIKKGYPMLTNRAKQMEKLLTQTEKLITDEKLTEAEKRFQPEYRKLAAMAYWYLQPQREPPMLRYDRLCGDLNNAIRVANKKRAQQVIAKLRDDTRPDFLRLSTTVAEAAKRLNDSAEVEFEGSQVPGPKVFMTACKQWYGMHGAALRTIAAHWALTDQQAGAPSPDEVVKTYADFQPAMQANLAALIEADAARATESEAAVLYNSYVKGIAEISAVSRDEEFAKAFAVALEKLAAKSPTLLADVTAYQGATQDWLRWRARSATLAAQARSKSPEVALPIAAAEGPRLDYAATDILAKVVTEALGKQTVVPATFLSATKTGKPTSGYLNWMFCRASTADPLADPTLEADLLVSKETPALSLLAARALASQKRGVLVEVGGKITGVELIGMTPFYAVDSDDRKAVVTMGPLPKLATVGYEAPLLHLHIIASIEPTWVRGEYFFAELK